MYHRTHVSMCVYFFQSFYKVYIHFESRSKAIESTQFYTSFFGTNSHLILTLYGRLDHQWIMLDACIQIRSLLNTLQWCVQLIVAYFMLVIFLHGCRRVTWCLRCFLFRSKDILESRLLLRTSTKFRFFRELDQECDFDVTGVALTCRLPLKRLLRKVKRKKTRKLKKNILF